MNRSNLPRALAAMLVVAALGLAGCGDDDGGEAAADASATTAPTGSGSRGTGSGDGTASSEDRTTFGYRIDGAPGTTVEVETVAETEAGPSDMSQSWTVTNEPRWSLYTNWVTGGEITFELTEGEAATVEIIRGHTVEPDNPFAELEVVEVIETVEVSADAPVTVTLP